MNSLTAGHSFFFLFFNLTGKWMTERKGKLGRVSSAKCKIKRVNGKVPINNFIMNFCMYSETRQIQVKITQNVSVIRRAYMLLLGCHCKNESKFHTGEDILVWRIWYKLTGAPKSISSLWQVCTVPSHGNYMMWWGLLYPPVLTGIDFLWYHGATNQISPPCHKYLWHCLDLLNSFPIFNFLLAGFSSVCAGPCLLP